MSESNYKSFAEDSLQPKEFSFNNLNLKKAKEIMKDISF